MSSEESAPDIEEVLIKTKRASLFGHRKSLRELMERMERENLHVSVAEIEIPLEYRSRKWRASLSSITPFIMLAITLTGFFYFLFQISSLFEACNLNVVLTYYAFNFIFISKSIQLFLERDELFSRGINLKPIFNHVIPIAFCLSLLIYTFFINTPFDILANLNYAMEDLYLIAFPVLLFVFIGVSIFNSAYSNTEAAIEEIIEQRKLRRFEDPQAMLTHRIFNHISGSILILFIISVMLVFYDFTIIAHIIFDSTVIVFFNIGYWKAFPYMSEISKNWKTKRIERRKDDSRLSFVDKVKNRKKENLSVKQIITVKQLVIIGVSVFLICAYFFNLFGLQDNIINIFTLIIEESWLLGLGIIVLILFVLIPAVSLFINFGLKASRFIYEKGLKKVFIFIFAYMIFVLFIKIFIFNLNLLELSTLWESIITYGTPAALFLLKKVTKKGVKKSVKKVI